MSNLLWKYYFEDNLDGFQNLLANATYNVRPHAHKAPSGGALKDGLPPASSLGPHNASPTLTTKNRKAVPTLDISEIVLHRSDLNSTDNNGMTILHHAASSQAENAVGFALALLQHPLTDLYVQDHENGWTPLHRAFYFGNIVIARAMLGRATEDALGAGSAGAANHAVGLIKIKDKEGNGPFDVLASTIDEEHAKSENEYLDSDSNDAGSNYDPTGDGLQDVSISVSSKNCNIDGNEIFTFGSNKNVTLGFGDEDDRHFPERIVLRRPLHLLQKFHHERVEREAKKWAALDPAWSEHLTTNLSEPTSPKELPAVIRATPIAIRDVFMSKLHSAVLTEDPVANLYICGHGHGGRLGTGSETTHFNFTCVEGGGLAKRKVVTVALGLNHTLALTDEGEAFAWGSNTFGQLGYSVTGTSRRDEEPIQTLPRQIYGPLKREIVIGLSASRIHSVAFTESSLFTWGKNEGQLGFIDSDARSLEAQTTPRKVAASLLSAGIASACAIDKATICLLQNHEVWVFANYGYAKVTFPLEGFSNYFLRKSFRATRYDKEPNRICKITAGGDAICALSSAGEIFAVAVSTNGDISAPTASTTNPSKIRSALSAPQRIWSLGKSHMSARDVAVDNDGSIILTTQAGSVWRRVKRAKIKHQPISGASGYKSTDYKFQRIPGLTRIKAVRASGHGAYAAIRKDIDDLNHAIGVDEQELWKHIFELLPFKSLATVQSSDSEDENPEPRFWRPSLKQRPKLALLKHIYESSDIEKELGELFSFDSSSSSTKYAVYIGTTVSDVRLPVHKFILFGRSRALRQLFAEFEQTGFASISELLSIEYSSNGSILLQFQGLDFLSILNLVLYCYTDSVVIWQVTKQTATLAYRYRQVRLEMMKAASKLEMHRLEESARRMVAPKPSLDLDMLSALRDATYLSDGDIEIELSDDTIRVHSALMHQRCPFFEGLFAGRAGGRWLQERRTTADESSDAIKVDLKHFDAQVFNLVLRYLYSDAGPEIFDDLVCESLDEFLDLILDVMGVANELMLDRLSQICQRALGRYTTVRNVCSLLNAVAPSSVARYKRASLQYLTFSLEAVLETGLLNELDEELLFELDQVVQRYQVASSPMMRSGQLITALVERHPELLEMSARLQQAKLDQINFRTKHATVDGRPQALRSGHDWDEVPSAPTPSKQRRKSQSSTGASPKLKGKLPPAEMIFEMEDGEDVVLPDKMESPYLHPIDTQHLGSSPSSLPSQQWYDARGKKLSPHPDASLPASPDQSRGSLADRRDSYPSPTLRSKEAPWGSSPMAARKLDLKDIMAQTSSGKTSGIALGLSKQQSSSAHTATGAKMSQKDRKKMQQTQLGSQQQTPSKPTPARDDTTDVRPSSSTSAPWQNVSQNKPKVDMKDVLRNESRASVSESPSSREAKPSPQSGRGAPSLTMRQTIANPSAKPSKPDSPSSSRQPPPPSKPSQRSVSSPIVPSQSTPQRRRQSEQQQQKHDPSNNTPGKSQPPDSPPASGPGFAISQTLASINPQSVRHIPLPVPEHLSHDVGLGLSMHDILAQQQAEKQVIIDAATTKRSLQDIQAEQAFQEWWDKESARVQAEAAPPPQASTADAGTGSSRSATASSRQRDAGEKGREKSRSSRGRSRPKDRAAGGGGSGDRASAEAKGSGSMASGSAPAGGSGSSRREGGRGRGRGHRGKARGTQGAETSSSQGA